MALPACFLKKSMFNLNGDIIEGILFFPKIVSCLEFIIAGGVVEAMGKSWPLKDIRIFILGDSPSVRSKDIWLRDMNSFYPTLATVIVTGIIMTLSVFIISLISFRVLRHLKQRADSLVD